MDSRNCGRERGGGGGVRAKRGGCTIKVIRRPISPFNSLNLLLSRHRSSSISPCHPPSSLLDRARSLSLSLCSLYISVGRCHSTVQFRGRSKLAISAGRIGRNEAPNPIVLLFKQPRFSFAVRAIRFLAARSYLHRGLRTGRRGWNNLSRPNEISGDRVATRTAETRIPERFNATGLGLLVLFVRQSPRGRYVTCRVRRERRGGGP